MGRPRKVGEEYLELRRCENGHVYVYRRRDGEEANKFCPLCFSKKYTVEYVKRFVNGLYVWEEVRSEST